MGFLTIPNWKELFKDKQLVVFDIEANGLTPDKIWCICWKNIHTKERDEHTVRKPNLEAFKRLVDDDNVILVGHNILSYDIVVINKLLKWNIKTKKCLDTFVLSTLFNPTREKGHSLEEWAIRLGGIKKQEHEDWSQFSDEMLSRCRSDVDINCNVLIRLLNEGKGFSWKSIRLEHDVTTILERQKAYGFYLDYDKAVALHLETKTKALKLQEQIIKTFPMHVECTNVVTPRWSKGGKLMKVYVKYFGENATPNECGPCSIVEFVPFNLGSPKQLVTLLNRWGWKPYIFTKTGTPKICEENLTTIPETAPNEAKLITEYSMLTSRYKTCEGWFNALGSDGRIHGTVVSCGSITHRMAHRNPNMANIPSVSSPYGKEARACFTVSDKVNRRLVGVDAKGIQLRVLAHYMDDEEFTRELLTGDPHVRNQKAAGLKDRPTAKTWIYALLLGAGDLKLGTIAGGTAEDGRKSKEMFTKNTPGFARLKKEIKTVARQGWMYGIDGRIMQVKSEHFAMSNYLQGCEAVVMKLALVKWYSEVCRRGLDAHPVGLIHDEYQIDCHKDCAEEVAKIVEQAIRDAGEELKLRCPMDGDSRIGLDWYETH